MKALFEIMKIPTAFQVFYRKVRETKIPIDHCFYKKIYIFSVKSTVFLTRNEIKRVDFTEILHTALLHEKFTLTIKYFVKLILY